VIDVNREIQELQQGKTYKYLGIEEREGIQHYKITAIEAVAVPELRYSFGIINWRIEEIKQIDRKTRKMLTMYKMHHPKADIDRLYVKRKEGGRGLVQVEGA
jgi:predicted GNAT family acetyltransferase